MSVYLLNTLSRPDAIRDRKADQIDHAQGFVALNREGRRQTKKYRATVPLTATLRAWTLELPKGPSGAIPRKAVRSTKTAVRSARKRAGLDEQVTFYSLPRSGSIALRCAGPPSDQIAIMLGHRPVNSKRVTETYSPFKPDYLEEARRAIEAWVCNIAALCRRHDLLKPFSACLAPTD